MSNLKTRIAHAGALVLIGLVSGLLLAQSTAPGTGVHGSSGDTGVTGAQGASGGSGPVALPAVGSVLATIIPKGNPQKIPVETIVIHDSFAMPNAITRHTGPFYLYLINAGRTTGNDLVLAAESKTPAQAAALAPTLNMPEFAKARRVAGLFNAPAGVYQLKSSKTNKVFLTITIQ